MGLSGKAAEDYIKVKRFVNLCMHDNQTRSGNSAKLKAFKISYDLLSALSCADVSKFYLLIFQ